MKLFQYVRPSEAKAALTAISSEPTAKFIGGGTNLLDLMKHDIASPDKLVDITRLSLKKIFQKKVRKHVLVRLQKIRR